MMLWLTGAVVLPPPLFICSSINDAFRHIQQPPPPATVSTSAASPPPPQLLCPAHRACSGGESSSWSSSSGGAGSSWRGPGCQWQDHPDGMRAAEPPFTKLHQPTVALIHGHHWPQGVHFHDAAIQWVETRDVMMTSQSNSRYSPADLADFIQTKCSTLIECRSEVSIKGQEVNSSLFTWGKGLHDLCCCSCLFLKLFSSTWL